MWTGDEETYRRSFVRMLDYYLDLADRTATSPPEYQSRWHADGSFWIWTYEHDKPAADFARLIARIRDGHISFPRNALVSTYGGTPTEAVLRGMYYSGSLERRFGLKIPMAIANENQTLPYGLGALWAGSGAQYSWRGICGCASKIGFYGKRPHELYWWKGDDGSRILMKWNALTPGRSLMGNYLEARLMAKAVDHVDNDAGFRAAYPYPVIGVFGKGGDDLETLTSEFPEVARATTTPQRQVIVSNMVDYFEDAVKSLGAKLPEYSGGFGNEWDLYTASVSELAARMRRSTEKLRAAEALATMVSLAKPEFLEGRQQSRDQAWMGFGIFWEHDWTADGPVSRAQRNDWGRKVARQVEAYVDGLHEDAAYALGGLIQSPAAARRFYVFNPLGWTRTDAADLPFSETAPVHVVDLTAAEEAPSQIFVAPDGRRYLRVLAKDLPPVGYKVFELRAGAGRTFTPAATAEAQTLENARYRIRLAGSGAITSVIDKTQGGREFVDRTWNSLGPDTGSVEAENAGPVSVTLRATAPGPLAHVTRVTVVRDLDRIDIRNDINQNFDGTHSWSFNFKLTQPDVWHEESGAVIRARTLAEGGHYSAEMSRLEWLTLNHFADMSGPTGEGITLSNSDLSFLKLGNSRMVDGASVLDTRTPRLQILAGGQVDGPGLGIHGQGGDSHFLQRFALRTHTEYRAPQAMRFALEHQNPPVAGWVHGSGPYPGKTYSLVEVSNPNVLLWAVKPAEDGIGTGIVARTWNLEASPQPYTLQWTPEIASAARVTHVETRIAPLPVTAHAVELRAERSQMQSVLIQPAKVH